MTRKIYIIGSLRNPLIPDVAKRLRADSHEVFDEWWGAGESADDSWQSYEQQRGRSYRDALKGHAAQHIAAFDKKFLDWADTGVLVAPAGKSAHGELGYMTGCGKEGYVLFDKEPERYDVMYNLIAKDVFFSIEELAAELKRSKDSDDLWKRYQYVTRSTIFNRFD